MAFNNRNNLSNESAPWGREVEQKIESNTYDLSQLRLLTENNNKATNGTLSALTRQQQTLAEQQTQLQTTQQTLADQQAQLATQQTALTDQQQTLQSQQDQLRNGVDVDGWAYDAPINPTSNYFELTRTLAVPEWATSLYVTAYATVEGTIASGTSSLVDGQLYVSLARDSDPGSAFLQVSASGIQLPGQLYFIGGHNQRITKIDIEDMTTLFINISAFVSPIPPSGKAVGFYSGVTAFWRAD